MIYKENDNVGYVVEDDVAVELLKHPTFKTRPNCLIRNANFVSQEMQTKMLEDFKIEKKIEIKPVAGKIAKKKSTKKVAKKKISKKV